MALYQDEAGHYRLRAAGRPSAVADANRFLAALVVRGLSAATMRAYGYYLVSFCRWLGRAGHTLRSLPSAAMLDYVAAQRAAGARPASINRRLVTCGLVYRFVTGRELERDPAVYPLCPAPHYRGQTRDFRLGLRQRPRGPGRKLRIKSARRVVEPLTVAEVRAFLHHLRRYRDLAIVHLMLLSGLRSAEVVHLQTSDLFFDEGHLRVQGKGGKERVLPMPDLLARSLSRYLEWERPASCATLRLFVVLQGAHRGRPITMAGLRSLFRHRRRDPQLARANPHRFRHTFGADMARAGVRLPLLQRMMGHADGATTLQYIHLSMADIADEYRRAMRDIERRYHREP